jgi:hypothetical protein
MVLKDVTYANSSPKRNYSHSALEVILEENLGHQILGLVDLFMFFPKGQLSSKKIFLQNFFLL